jgi:hypothetical protein
MRMFMMKRLLIVSSLWFACIAGIPTVTDAQAIHACAKKTNGSLRIAPGGTCEANETSITLGGGTTFYTKWSPLMLIPVSANNGLTVFCDDPSDIAVSGGWHWENNTPQPAFVTINARCDPMRTCGGPNGEDGWRVEVYIPPEYGTSRLQTFVICASQ